MKEIYTPRKLARKIAKANMKKAGIRPMLHGFIISALVVIVALVVEICMGIV